ncbi:SDR family oxidoreductase [Kribbella antibiotica]|uniref:SDR family oxidoreductase n=1 Tax=Kribbella antibiotica TaxID=190195 RepID=A0A4R4ZTM8_9ACTN|nr:type I polyketide synthase [Kribbella antibiotica]TDD61686.1 SDR family oxidoreductase [Kribbella antibiotica]
MSDFVRPQQIPVAVVGVGALMPGATDAGAFWRNIVTGRDLVTEVPSTHWLVEDYYDPDPSAPDKTYGRTGAFLPAVEFDPMAYGVPPNTLPATDTSQLLALLVAEEVLADAGGGEPAALDRDRVSVILGTSALDLLTTMGNRMQRPVWLKAMREQGLPEPQVQQLCDRIAEHYVPWQEATFPGLLGNVVAGRIANRFDLHGSNYTTDAACASSLAAVSNAVDELALGHSDMVVTGGVDTLNDILMYMCFSKTPALSPSGDCRPFSDGADGTILGEGLVMLALKRLSDAERDADRVYAVIRGIGSSSDGRSTAIYAPLPAGQARALRRAYESAGYGPDTVELVEAHGTGTKAGDAAEFAALKEVFAESGRDDEQWCALGSLKSQVGHTKSAAGAAGLFKAVMSLHHKVLPPTIKVDKPSPALGVDGSPLYLNTEVRPWTRAADHPRRASVSSFGFGGSNFHLTLEEYVPSRPEAVRAWRSRTAASELVLFGDATADELLSKVGDVGSGSLADIARRSQREFDAGTAVRLAIVASDVDDLRAKLIQAADLIHRQPHSALSTPNGIHYGVGEPVLEKLAFLFSGQGSQYVGMGADVAMLCPQAQQEWDRAAGWEIGDRPLHRVVFPVPVFTEPDRATQQAALTATEWAQPALAVQSLALLAVTRSLGLRPDFLAGHSFGELVALHAAGSFDAEALVRLARRRGELMRDADADAAGGMLAAQCSIEDVMVVLDEFGSDEVWVANHNAPRQVVLSGTADGISAVGERLRTSGVTTRKLDAAAAFHSPLVASASKPLLQYLDSVKVAAPTVDVYGNADSHVYPGDPDEVRQRIAGHITSQVRFVDEIEALYAAGTRVFVEIGAGSTLTGLVNETLGDRGHLSVSLDHRGRDGVTSLHDALGQIAVRGIELDFEALWTSYAPPAEEKTTTANMSTTLLGANYGKPYPPVGGAHELLPPNPPTPAPAVRQPVVAEEASTEWLQVMRETQQHTAEAHATYQRVIAESHLAFLKATETSFGGTIPAGTPVPNLPSPFTTSLEQPLPVTPTAVVDVPSAPPALTEPVPEAVPVPSAGAGVDVESMMLGIVAEKTGYPVDMLSADMALEGDLGIDSIKRVEILSTLRERVPGLPEVDAAVLGKLRTLGEIADQYGRGAGPNHSAEAIEEPLLRLEVRVVPVEASGLRLPGLGSEQVVVTAEGTGVADEVVTALRGHGISAIVVDEVPATAKAVVFLGGLRASTSVDEAVAVNAEAFRAAKAVAAGFAEEGGLFVTVQDTGGDFGLAGAEPVKAWQGGLVALAKTAAKEWPTASVKGIDCERGDRTAVEVAEAIVQELLDGGSTPAAGLRADGGRVIPVTVETPVVVGELNLGPDSVIVATGGGRGVTAAVLREFAKQHPSRIVLIGRTPLVDEDPALRGAEDDLALKRLLMATSGGQRPTPAELGAKVAGILAVREIRATLAALELAGSKARYLAVDVRDTEQLATALADVREQWGPITGLVHGAGVLADKSLVDKTGEQFQRVFDTKTAGLRALLAATANDPLTVLCLFSSVAAQYGNSGQSDYAMANEVLNQVAAVEQVRRPNCLVRAIGWGPWQGGMVTPSLAEHFREAGVPLIPVATGADAFVAELSGTGTGTQVVIAAGLDSPKPVSGDVWITDRSHPYLAGHTIAGTPVLPMVLALEWFAAAVHQWRPDPAPLTLREVSVLRKVAVDRFAERGHRLRVEGRPDGSVLALELLGEHGELHYRAFGEASTVPPGVHEPIAGEGSGNRELTVYDGTVLFHGPEFQVVRSLDILRDDGAAGTLAGLAEAGWPGQGWHTDPAMIDGGLQLALVWGHQVLGGAALPMSVREFRLYRRGPVDGLVSCVVRSRGRTTTTAECDITFHEMDGTPRAELLGVGLVLRPERG